MRKILKKFGISRLLLPLADALTSRETLALTEAECLQTLQSAHADGGKTALWDEPLPQAEGAYQLDIIVPAYNAEATLGECMRSILEQETAYAFRVILVDDGSTDGTAALADEYAARDNVLVLHQADGGAASARNSGIRRSGAPYLMFMDADDRLASGAIERLMACAQAHDADVAEGGYFNFRADGYRRAHPHRAGQMRPMEAYGMPWGKVMRRRLFEKAGFPEGYGFEDSALHQLVLPEAETCFGVSETAVERRLVASSAGHISRGNARSIDTIWVTRRLMRDRETLGLRVDQAYYEYLLDMAALSQFRLEGLDETIRQAAFGVFAGWITEKCAGFSTQRKQKRTLEAALRNRQYTRFKRYCGWA